MKKLIAVAVLAAFSSLPYAAEKDITTDVVVVGQGAAGTAAAFAAAEQGAKVIGLEKKGMVGGTGNFSEGIFAVGSKMQRDYYIPLTKDEAFKKIMNYGHWRSNARLVRAFVDKSADQSNGCRSTALSSKNSRLTIPAVSTHGTFIRAVVPAGSTLSRRKAKINTACRFS